ncbi:MAG TPA: sigma-70 family RNA polymerase sigma factor [Acidimicrobiia bacterium]
MNTDGQDALRPISPEIVDALVENHRSFLSFLERRVGNRASAEEILQSAYVRAVEKGVPADESEGAVHWFFAVLRNAVTDHYRRRAAEARATESVAAEGIPEITDPELRAEVCACFRRLLPTLREGYATILEQVDLEERSVSDVAKELGITPNNASVRLYRARGALRKQLERSCGVCATHGCLECTCADRISIDYRARPRTRPRPGSRGSDG